MAEPCTGFIFLHNLGGCWRVLFLHYHSRLQKEKPSCKSAFPEAGTSQILTDFLEHLNNLEDNKPRADKSDFLEQGNLEAN